MLHLTSLFQNASKLNNPSNKINLLNKLNKNYSFIKSYDINQKVDRFDFLYNNDDETEEFEEKGFFGCFRDTKADRKLISHNLSASSSTPIDNINNNHSSNTKLNYDGYWGVFKDNHSSYFNSDLEYVTKNSSHKLRPEEPIFYFESDSLEEQKRLKEKLFDNTVCNGSQLETKLENNQENDNLNENENCAKKLVYDYKRSKFKIEAGKRDQMKVFIQNLEDREMQLKKETIKKFDCNDKTNYLLLEAAATNLNKSSKKLINEFGTSYEDDSNLREQIKKIKPINFLHFSNKTNSNILDQSKTKSLLFSSSPESFSAFLKSNFDLIQKTNLDNFKNVFNILSKLNKSINIFNGNYLNIDEKSYLDHFLSFFNVNASQFDLNGLLYNLNKKFNLDNLNSQSSLNKNPSCNNISTTISLCSNIYDKNQKPFGYLNHSTMLFEHNGVKIGFMALVDQSFYNRLNSYIDQTEYVDFIIEANRLSKQLRTSGAHLIVTLINFDSPLNEQRLLNEASDLDLIFSSQTTNDSAQLNNNPNVDFKKINNKWLIKSSNNFDSLTLVSLHLDELNSNKIVDLAITKYYV